MYVEKYCDLIGSAGSAHLNYYKWSNSLLFLEKKMGKPNEKVINFKK